MQGASLLNVDTTKNGAKATPGNLSRHQDHDPLDGGFLVHHIRTDTNRAQACNNVQEARPLEQVPQGQH